ncbi:AsmA family protein [Brevundimonas subvibrioides]|uniref:AsmA family protein n=1 Tax=Brevundimonas subvibrioides (strain ATCC 15264 / DSM 4735 / LMG 14903 / NBRC 16000 / CB 81) TaxID=633149 RepID=D9QLB6_BRESC|nr:AsmA family protein [Brevundimonas subvibrioides]ADK99971.1 AsmA family protein [Brevundimonas subvibrioides ATCC 15264]
MSRSLNLKSLWQDIRTRGVAPAGARMGQWRDWVVENDPVYGSFRRPGRTEKIAASVVLVLIAAIVIFLLLFDWNWLRGPIGRWASAKYDREVALQGDLDVRLFSWTPSVIVNDLKFGGPSWATEADTANVERIEAQFRLRKLFVGQVEMPLLSITRPRVVLIATEDGRQSWDLEPDKPDDGEGAKLPLINRLVITDGRLSVDEQRRDLTLEAAVTAQEAASDADGQSGFVLEGEGSINGSPLTLKIEGGPFINIRRNRPYGFKATLAGAGSRLVADGAITRPFDLGQFTSTLSLQGQNLNDLYLLTGVTLPNTPAYRLAGALTRDDNIWTFNDFSGRVGASDLEGDVRVQGGGRLKVDATLSSQRLDIDDLTTILGGRAQTNAAGTDTTTISTGGTVGKLLPDATLQVERLRAMDGTISYRAASVKANDMDIRRVQLGGDLKDGVLNLDPVAFTFNRGTLTGTATIDANPEVPYSKIDFRLAGYPLESIIPARDGVAPVSGAALGRARLEGSGNSIHRFAAASKGSLSLVVPQGRMRAAFAELLGINASAGLLKLLRGDDSQSTIRCGVADFDVANGIARARTLVVDTDVVLASGTGSINLGDETMNLKIDGESKRPRLLRLWTPILVSGPLTAPRVGVDTSQIIGQGGLTALLGAVVAPVAALFAFVDPGLAEDANCGSLIANAR